VRKSSFHGALTPHAIGATQVKFDLINKGQVSKAKSTRNASL
jgi:hypothetical protein